MSDETTAKASSIGGGGDTGDNTSTTSKTTKPMIATETGKNGVMTTKPLPSSHSANQRAINAVEYDHRLPYIYNHYPTTISLLLLLHVIFLYHWNTRKKRHHVQSTYRTVIHRRQFHRVIYATLSHPAADDDPANVNNIVAASTSHNSNNDNNAERVNSRQSSLSSSWRCLTCLPSPPAFLHPVTSRFRHFLRPFCPGGSLSGLPQLACASHFLWQVRALEEYYGGAYKYVLLTLCLTSAALDLGMSAFWVYHVHGPDAVGVAPLTTATDGTRTVMDRPSCGMTSVVTSLLVLYGDRFPFVGMNVVPFVWTSYEGYFTAVGMGFVYGAVILFLVSRKAQPFGVFTGTLSAVLFELGLVRFLAVSSYWSKCLAGSVAMACAFSIRGSQADHNFIPCIDYVSWNNATTSFHHYSNRRRSEDSDLEQARFANNEEEGEEGTFLSFNHATDRTDPQTSHLDRPETATALRGRFQATATQQNLEGLGFTSNGGTARDHSHHPRGNLIDP